MEHIVTVDVNGLEAYMLGIEDLIVARFAAAKFWQSESDFDCFISSGCARGKDQLAVFKKADVKNVYVKAGREYKTIKKARENSES